METGTYVFAPGVGEVLLDAYARLQIQPTAITQQHILHGRREANFLQVEWANKGPNLWTVDYQAFDMVAGTDAYTVPANTVMILDLYLSIGGGDFSSDWSPTDFNVVTSRTDRMLTPMSRSEYAALPEKAIQGPPTSFWFDRLEAPIITFYPVPDQAYRIGYYRFRQMQDADPANGGTAEVPYLWLDALVAGMAHRLSRIYAPALEALRKADAMEAWKIAAAQNTENVSLYISPEMSSYYR
jgi:hypothetical protein